MKHVLETRLICGIILITILTWGCGGSGNNTKKAEIDPAEAENPAEDDEKSKIRLAKTKKIFYMLPSPIETASLLKKAGANYNKHILNPIENISTYETNSAKAINLGIYASDLSYTSIFDQTQESVLYVNCAKKMADGLGITRAFDQKTMERIEANINDKDSMLNIISDAFWTADEFLKENDQQNISALIIAGGWIEGLYLASELVRQDGEYNEAIKKRIAEQKYSLDHLIELIRNSEEDASLKMIEKDLSELTKIYESLEVVEKEAENKTDQKTGVTTIGATKEVIISNDQLVQIIAKIKLLRNKYNSIT